MIRLNKYIADSGVASRRKAEEYIQQGRVEVNGKTVIELAFKVEPVKDEVLLDGEKISPKKHIYILLNKPKGVVTTTEDEKNRKTVVDLIKINERIYPVGRLDYNTTGVLFLTNDGEFKQLLTHPRNKVPREYEVKIDKPLSEEHKVQMLKGVYLQGEKGKFGSVAFNKDSRVNINVVAIEGRNHFVKRMFRALGYTVTSLNRKSFAGITADVSVGNYRELSLKEIKGIFNKYGR